MQNCLGNRPKFDTLSVTDATLRISIVCVSISSHEFEMHTEKLSVFRLLTAFKSIDNHMFSASLVAEAFGVAFCLNAGFS